MHGIRFAARMFEFPPRSSSLSRVRHLSHIYTSISIALQSFFSGKTEKVDEVLYSRFTSPVDGGGGAKDGEVGAAATQVATSGAGNDVAVVKKETKKRKKERWSEERKSAAKLDRVVEDAKREASVGRVGGDGVRVENNKVVVEEKKVEKKARKKRDEGLKVTKVTKEERVSGPGNADEAMEMRERLGFVTNVDGMGIGQTGGFSFGFGGGEGGAGGGEDSSDGCGGSSRSSSSSSDDDDSEAPAPRAAQEPVQASAPAPHAVQATTITTTAGAPPEYGEFMPRRVFVGGMPFGYTEGMVQEYWEYCGPIESLDIMTFPDTGRFKGIAFITFATEAAYESALGYDGTDCDGQILKVQKCKVDKKKKRYGGAVEGGQAGEVAHTQQPAVVQQMTVPPTAVAVVAPSAAVPVAIPMPNQTSNASLAAKVPGYNVAYVGNIAFEASPDEIKALFEPYGVIKVRLHTDKDTGKPKGYAHVHFKDAEGLDKAVATNGTNFFGRNLRIGYAQQKKQAS